MRVAIYGGSFNPPHIGHAMVTGWLGWTAIVDEVWLTPTATHAFGKALAPFELRKAMCEELARTVGDFVKVCAIEAELPRPSYTIDTLRALSSRHPEHQFQLVIGADLLPTTPKWKRWDAIESDFGVILVGRGGYPPIEGMPTFPGVSSTEVRRRHDVGLDIGPLVPSGVKRLLRGVRFSA